MHEVVEDFDFPLHDIAIAIAILNVFILFKEHQSKVPDAEELYRTEDFPFAISRRRLYGNFVIFPNMVFPLCTLMSHLLHLQESLTQYTSQFSLM